MSNPKPTTTAVPSASGKFRRLAPLWDLARRLVAWAVANPTHAGLVALLMLGPVVPVVIVELARKNQPTPEPPPPTAKLALAALDRGADDEAARLAEALLQQGDLPANQRGAADFVMGMVEDHRAARASGDERTTHAALAAARLDEAKAAGLPPGRQPTCLYALGKNLLLSGQADKALAPLRAAVPLNPRRATELQSLLTEAHLALSPPRPAEALTHNLRYLADRKLQPTARQDGLIQQAKIRLELKQFSECRQTLDELAAAGASRREVALLMGRLLLAEARSMALPPAQGQPPASREDRAKAFQAAIDAFKQAIGRDQAGYGTTPVAEYLIGQCQLELEQPPAALEQFQRVAQRYAEAHEGFAAVFEVAGLHHRLNRDEDALAAWRGLFQIASANLSRPNPWLSLDDMRSRVASAFQTLLRRRQFAYALELAKLASPILPPERVELLVAEAHEHWGQSLLAGVDEERAGDASQNARAGRLQMRLAGAAYRRLAKLRFTTREYPNDLFASAEAKLIGRDYRGAARDYQQYLDVELRRRRPRALVGMGQALLAQGRPSEALSALRQCIDYHPRDVATFEARQMAAKAELELGDPAKAEALLRQNLEGDALTPASKEWRESLFDLGRLLYVASRYPEAIAALEEAVARYPNASATIEARYLAAEAYRRSAQQVREQSEAEATAEGRLARRREVERLLSAGLALYERQLEELLHHQEEGQLPPPERSILRNCYFARGAILFELGRYADAIQAYASATNRFQHAPEVLDAYVQIAACYRRLGKPIEARSTLEQAKYALKRIGPEARFADTSNYSREEWVRLLDTLGTL